MRIVGLTDIHGRASSIAPFAQVLQAADVVVLCGDLTHFGGARDAQRVVQAVLEHTPAVLAVHGNCDRPEVAEFLAAQGISLHGRRVIRDDVAFLGLGGSLPAPGGTPSEFSEAELARALSQAAAELDADIPRVLVSHQPPRDTALDVIGTGAHVGSDAVRQFIEQHSPCVCFTGHIHESAGTDTLAGCHVVNPGPASGGRCAVAEVEPGGEPRVRIEAV